MSKAPRWLSPLLLIPLALVLSSCSAGDKSALRLDYDMGERVTLGPLTYNVVESAWRSQLGSGFSVRVPNQRFLTITISVTNGGGRDVSVPLLTLQNSNGQSFQESENGQNVDNWFGILRTIAPAQTQQGTIVFDVPLSSYKLRLSDGGPAGSEKYAMVSIPMRIDAEPALGPTADPSK